MDEKLQAILDELKHQTDLSAEMSAQNNRLADDRVAASHRLVVDAHARGLRDYFAAQALPKCLQESWGEEGGAESAAIGAYQIADAMLKERERSK